MLNVHDIKVGNHDREILVIQTVGMDKLFKYYTQNEIEDIKDIQVLLIIDFSVCPPTIQTV